MSLPFVTTEPGTDMAGPGDMKLLSQSDIKLLVQFFVDCS